ncbi:MAG: hypothetical protein C4B58_14915 [Deltaproteobacteria bacterium]|nr:MAG: hypothetical protein C4B58_14915 [Deltaproteobacteria bacterium]
MKTERSLKQIFDKWKDRVEQLIKEHPLQIISWEATRRCNLNCVHCGSPAEDVVLSDELSTEEVIFAFEQVAIDFDMNQFRHINITGGEPFVRKDLLDILKQISKYSFYRNIDIQTNGIFIADNPEILRELKKYGVTGLGISIDGLESTHDVFRRRRGSFAKAFKAARLSVENGYVVTVSTVAHARNIHEIPQLFELIRKEIKPRVFRVMTIDPIGRAKFDSEYMLSPVQLRQLINFLKEEYRESCLTYADSKSTMVELGCCGWTGTELEGTFRPFIFHCIAGINNLGILYDGKLAACSNISRAFIEGDLRKERIKDVWESRYQRYRNFEWKKIADCANCDQWDYCHGGPMHKRLPDGRMLNCIYKILEEEKSQIPLAKPEA